MTSTNPQIETLQRQNRLLKTMIDTLPAMVAYVSTDFHYLNVNAAYAKHWNRSVDEIVGRHAAEIVGEEFFAKVQNNLYRVLAGEAVQVEVPMQEVATGQWRDKEVTYAPDRNAEGEITGINVLITDITQRNLANARLEVGIKVARLGVADVDYSTNLVQLTAEAAQLYGMGSTEIVVTREQFHASFFQEDLEIMERRIGEILKPGSTTKAIVCEHRVLLADGTIRWLEVCKEVYSCAPDGRPLRSILAARDVTSFKDIQRDLERAATEAKAANESKSTFLASMSHEIRTPMTAILGYTDLIANSPLDDSGKEYVRIVRRNGQFLLGIINDILDLSKIEAGKLEVSMEPVDPARILEDIRSIMDVRAREEQLKFGIEFKGPIPAKIQSDAKRLKQILFNLVGNAIKFTSEGEVKVVVRFLEEYSRTASGSSALEISVHDTGIGISQELRQQLFAPFTQGHVEIDREYGGTGLGLAISRRLARLIGGEIELTSEPGKGSTFTVILPVGLQKPELVDVKPTVDAAQLTEAFAEPVDLAAHVLVVDDRRDIRMLERTVLVKNGASVDEAEDGEHALDRYARSIMDGKSYDLIILDMQMPRLDGFQAAARLRKMGCEIPIVALTAEAMQGDSNRCIEAGCDAYLSKPINFNLFLQTIRKLLHK